MVNGGRPAGRPAPAVAPALPVSALPVSALLVSVLFVSVLAGAPAATAADPPPPDPLGLLLPPAPPGPDGPGPGPEPDAMPESPLVPGLADVETRAEAERRVRAAVVRTAVGELRQKRAKETGDNCSFYNAAVEGDGRRCGIEWCTQFIRWVWREAGADVGGLTYRPDSLRRHGRKHGTWHPGESLKGIRPGDAVTFRLDQPGRLGHANIVVAVRGKRVTTVGGNERGGTVRRTTWRIGYGTASGYASPVPPRG